jgi:hypothetical protein
MNLRMWTGALLVGALGLAALALALGVERLAAKQLAAFIAAHPEAFPMSPLRAGFLLAVATAWLGFGFAFVFDQAHARAPELPDSLGFAALCWLGLVAPVAALFLFWTPLPRAGIVAVAAGWLLQLIAGSALLAWLKRTEVPEAA